MTAATCGVRGAASAGGARGHSVRKSPIWTKVSPFTTAEPRPLTDTPARVVLQLLYHPMSGRVMVPETGAGTGVESLLT